MIRTNVDSSDYQEVKDSASLTEFGEKYLSTPGSKAQLMSRKFVNLLPEHVLARKDAVKDTGGTLEGISRKFQYICKVKKYFSYIKIICHFYLGGWDSSLAEISMFLSFLHY